MRAGRAMVRVLGLLLLLAGALHAQEPASVSRPDSLPPTGTDTAPAARKDDGRFKFTPLLAPAYNPEMQFLIAGGVLLSWKADPADTLEPRSTLSTTVSIGSIGALNVAGRLSSFWKHDRLRIRADLSLKDMVDGYWGVGLDAGLQPLDIDSTTQYQRKWWAVRPTVLWRVRPHLFVGPMVDVSRTEATGVSSAIAADSAFQFAGPSVFNVGAGAVVEYDTRDVPGNAWRGMLLSANLMVYGPVLGSDWAFQTLLLDYRHYRSLGRVGRTLAWQVRSRLSLGDVPWTELSLLGSGNEFRGYREGRFRAPQAVSAVAEYRHTFTRSGGRLSRHGFTVFAGLGVLGSKRFELEGPLPVYGVGYRFELQPRANVRIDFGAGRNSTGVYFSFMEAF